MEQLTVVQSDTLKYINSYIENHGISPTHDELASISSVSSTNTITERI